MDDTFAIRIKDAELERQNRLDASAAGAEKRIEAAQRQAAQLEAEAVDRAETLEREAVARGEESGRIEAESIRQESDTESQRLRDVGVARHDEAVDWLVEALFESKGP